MEQMVDTWRLDLVRVVNLLILLCIDSLLCIFIPNPNNLPFVNHIDENKLNNSINNLEWCTQVYNTNYGEGIKRRVQSRLLSGEGRHSYNSFG